MLELIVIAFVLFAVLAVIAVITFGASVFEALFHVAMAPLAIAGFFLKLALGLVGLVLAIIVLPVLFGVGVAVFVPLLVIALPFLVLIALLWGTAAAFGCA